MNQMTQTDTVLAFVEAINRHNIDDISSLIAFDHKFTDIKGNSLKNRKNVLSAWSSYFNINPSYCIHVSEILSDNGAVVLRAKTTSHSKTPRHQEFKKTLLLSAKVRGNKVSEWALHKDTPVNLSKLK